MMNIRLAFFIVSIVIFSSCTSINSLYTQISNAKDNDIVYDENAKEILGYKVAFDRYGNIYPRFDENKTIDEELLRNSNSGDLCSYFTYKTNHINDNCDVSFPPKSFMQMQDKIYAEYADDIHKLKTQEILFLIHGFNNNYAQVKQNYSDAKFRILRFLREHNILKTPTIIEIYWDGMQNPSWANATYNAAMVGKGLRKLINSISKNQDSNTNLLFLTHSTGSQVATSALFDVVVGSSKECGVDSSIFTNEEDQRINYDKHNSYMKTLPLPKLNSTLAMIAPAMGTTPFTCLLCPQHSYYQKNKEVISKITFISGINQFDYALNKEVGIPYIGGDTNFGLDIENCKNFQKIYKDHNITMNCIDYGKFYDEKLSKDPLVRIHQDMPDGATIHAFNYYLFNKDRKNATEELLSLLFKSLTSEKDKKK